MKDRSFTVLLNKSSRKLKPLFIVDGDQLKQEHFQVVAVALCLVGSKLVAGVKVYEACAAGLSVIQDVAEMHIAMRPSGSETAAFKLMGSPQFAGRRDDWLEVRSGATNQLPEARARQFRNADSFARPDSHATPVGIEQT